MSIKLDLSKAEIRALARFLTDEYVKGYRSAPLKAATAKILRAHFEATLSIDVYREFGARS